MKAQQILKVLTAKNRNLRQIDFNEIEEHIEKVNISNLVAIACSSTSSLGTEEIMLGLFKYWKGFSYEDWKNVIYKIKSSEIGLINLIIFIGKYLHIDLRPELGTIEAEKKKYVLDYLHEETPLFYYDKERNSKMLERFHLSFDASFSNMRRRLAMQGGTKARIVAPKKIDITDLPALS